MGRAVWVVAQRSTIEATKRQPRAQGLKPQHYSHRQIVEAAEDYLAQHPELIAEAKETVLRWQAEAFLGKRAAPSIRNDPEIRVSGTAAHAAAFNRIQARQ